MGFIYKITNKVNNKIYVGQTIKTVEKRFQQHKNNSNKDYFSQIVLYQAFRKYGIDNFICETIEEVENEKLDEREKYWIEYYNSYLEGYNSTLGGRTVTLYKWDVEDIIEKYYQLKSSRKVAKVIGCDHNTIDNILNVYGVKRFTPAQQFSTSIVFKKEDTLLRFETTTEAAEYLMAHHISKSKNIVSLRQMLTEYARKEKTLYGYQVYYENKR